MNAIFIFRRDLRLEDNVGLHYALENYNVLPIVNYKEARQLSIDTFRKVLK